MLFKVSKLRQMTVEQFADTLQKQIQMLYEEYKFIGLSKESYDELILSFLEKVLKKFVDHATIQEVDSSYFVTYIRKKLNSYVHELLEDKKSFFQVVSNYISTNLKEQTESNLALQELERLSSFFHSISFDLTPDLEFELIIRNTLLKSLISVFVLENEEQLRKNMESVLNFNDIINSFIETYCMMFEVTDENTETKEDLYDVRPFVIRAQEGDISARDEIFQRNLRLVQLIASKYQYFGFPFEDVEQIGYIGLLKAIDKFDPKFGCRFSTYATRWIRREIVRDLANYGRTIRISVKEDEKFQKLKKVQEKLTVSLGRDPDVQELSDTSGFSEDQILELQNIPVNTTSIEDLEASKYSEIEYRASLENVGMDESIINRDVLQRFRNLLCEECNLKPLDIEILLQLYGFYGRIKTQVEVAEDMGIKNESVRQREAKAIRDLRRHPSIKEYAILMDNPTKAKERIDLHREQYRKYGTRATYSLKLLDEEKMEKELQKKKTKSR